MYFDEYLGHSLFDAHQAAGDKQSEQEDPVGCGGDDFARGQRRRSIQGDGENDNERKRN